MALEGGRFGKATDFVLLVMNEGGARGILAGKVRLGGDASITAGPVGRDASTETDVTLRLEILSYSRSRGLLANLWESPRRHTDCALGPSQSARRCGAASQTIS